MKLTTDVPEGEYCGECQFASNYGPDKKCKLFIEERPMENRSPGAWYHMKCPACISACQQYREAHEKLREAIIFELSFHTDTDFDLAYMIADRVSKALNINKEQPPKDSKWSNQGGGGEYKKINGANINIEYPPCSQTTISDRCGNKNIEKYEQDCKMDGGIQRMCPHYKACMDTEKYRAQYKGV